MNLKVLIYELKAAVFAGIRRVFISITFLFTPIQLVQFLHWKFFKFKPSTNTVFTMNTNIDQSDSGRKSKKFKVAIILHVFYPDIGIDILKQVLPKSNHFDKILITHTMNASILNEFQNSVPDDLLSKCHFMVTENRSRDCGPFIQASSSPYLSDCEVFLKLHTKKSPHLPNDEGSTWRRDLIDGLLNPIDLRKLIQQLAAASEPLWACPEPWISTKSSWGFNSFQVWKLTSKLGIAFQGPQQFPLGNMYWLNSRILCDVKSLKQSLNPNSKSLPTFLKDGNWMHALERIPSCYKLIKFRCN